MTELDSCLSRSTRLAAAVALAAIGLGAAVLPLPTQAASVTSAFQPKSLTAQELHHAMVGNTVHYASPDDDVFEYYNPDGTIHGISKKNGTYSANWKIRPDGTFCEVSSDPKSSGCAFVVSQPGKITYFRYDEITEGPFDVLPGNPKQL